jgi:hypothetical protein
MLFHHVLWIFYHYTFFFKLNKIANWYTPRQQKKFPADFIVFLNHRMSNVTI